MTNCSYRCGHSAAVERGSLAIAQIKPTSVPPSRRRSGYTVRSTSPTNAQVRPRARTRFRTMLVVLCALLLSRWTLAAHACPGYAALGEAIGRGAAAAAAGMHAGCEDERSTICEKHCLDESQATAQSALAAAPPPAVVWWTPERHTDEGVLPAVRRFPAQAQAPPITILYCISLT